MKESILRTIVPIIYALLIKGGLDKLGVDDALIQSLAAAIGSGLIYVVVRFLESHKASFGWLLGSPHAPTYTVGEED